MKRFNRFLAILLSIMIASVTIFGSMVTCFAATEDDSVLYSYLEGKRAAVMTGTPQDGWIREKVKEGPIAYYASFPDELIAMNENKVDYLIIPTVNFNMVKDNYPDLCQTDVVATEQGISFLMNKDEEGKALKKEIDAYIKELEESGELQELVSYWIDDLSDKEAVEIPEEGEKGVLKLATTSSLMPYTYKVGEDFSGFEIAILASFCKENGYGLEIGDMDFSGILSGVTSGKYDLGCGGVSATEERRKSAYFCEYTYVQKFCVVMRAEDVPDGVEILSQSEKDATLSIKEKLYNNFIAESRWKMLLKGTGVTTGVTILATILGTLLGYLICRLSISESKALRKFAGGYIYILAGLPQVLLLMIFCFVIFANTNLPEFWVAVIAFMFNFSATVASVLKSGIDNIDAGQMEAAYTLGYSKKKAFNKFILPQVVDNCYEVYKGQVITLLKATSIVGYIAVQDITKVADVIRSRTFDAFIPLVFAGILYFILAAILIRVMSWVYVHFVKAKNDPREGSMLKEVELI